MAADYSYMGTPVAQVNSYWGANGMQATPSVTPAAQKPAVKKPDLRQQVLQAVAQQRQSALQNNVERYNTGAGLLGLPQMGAYGGGGGQSNFVRDSLYGSLLGSPNDAQANAAQKMMMFGPGGSSKFAQDSLYAALLQSPQDVQNRAAVKAMMFGGGMGAYG